MFIINDVFCPVDMMGVPRLLRLRDLLRLAPDTQKKRRRKSEMKDRRVQTPLDLRTPFCGGVNQGIQFGCLYCGTEEMEFDSGKVVHLLRQQVDESWRAKSGVSPWR